MYDKHSLCINYLNMAFAMRMSTKQWFCYFDECDFAGYFYQTIPINFFYASYCFPSQIINKINL